MGNLILYTEREGYAVDQCRQTMTVGDLIEFLQDYDEKTPIYLAFDRGYTYGSIREYRFEMEESENDE